MAQLNNCSTVSNNKIITASENGRTFKIDNGIGATIKKVQVDGCLIQNEDGVKACDYFFEITHQQNKELVNIVVVYLELKGCDVKKGLQQLESAVKRFSSQHSNFKDKRCCVVASRHPKEDTTTQTLKLGFIKKYGIPLKIGTVQVTFVLDANGNHKFADK